MRGIAGWNRCARIALAAALLLPPAAARGASGEVFVTPARGVRNSTGLTLAVDTQWVEGSGYRWVRLHVGTAGKVPSPRDRTLRIEIAPNSSGGHRPVVARGYVELKQGAAGASAGLLVPQSGPWQWIDISVYEGGALRRELSTSAGLGGSPQYFSEGTPSLLVIDQDAPTSLERASLLEQFSRNPGAFAADRSTLPDIRGLKAVVNRSEFYGLNADPPPSDIHLLRELSEAPRLELLPPADLPDRWPGLACVDLAIVPLDDLQRMAAERRPQFDALIAWCAAGGNLVVYGVGNEYARLAELESLAKLSPRTVAGNFQAAGWKPADSGKMHSAALDVMRNFQASPYYYPDERKTEPPPPVDPQTLEQQAANFGTRENPRFLLRPLGMGMIVAMPAANPFPSDATAWSWLLNHLETGRWAWFKRHGLTMQGANDDFWEFLVPGTGKAPVWPFCVLITLFAVLIGPVNYFVLQRQKRLYLLLATIPLGAALVTLGLFGYAIVTEGLGTRLRMRSYTHLDQNAGRSVNWSRQSYYASIAPAGGLSFPDDAVVYPYEHYPQGDYSNRWERQRLYSWEDGQHFQSGYMSSRITSQFLVVRSAATSAGVIFAQQRTPQQASNRLGAKIEYLLARDRDGNYFVAENVLDGATFPLASTQFAPQRHQLSQRLNAHRPELPAGFDPNQLGGLMWRYRSRGYGDAADMETSLLETRLKQLREADAQTLRPGSYVAIVDRSPAAPIGISGARQEASLHVVEGEF